MESLIQGSIPIATSMEQTTVSLLPHYHNSKKHINKLISKNQALRLL